MPNGSPYEHDKQDERLKLAVARVTETGLPLIYVNQVGGQDELVFDGALLRAQRRPAPRGASARRWRGGSLITAGSAARTSGWAAPPGEIAPAVEGLEASITR